jgi:beta-xylosidase
VVAGQARGRSYSEYQWMRGTRPVSSSAVRWLKQLGVRKLRTGLSWADAFRPGAEAWFDRQMRALDDFDLTLTFCFTPEHRGLQPHHTSAPQVPQEYAEFCARMVRRYVGHDALPVAPERPLAALA